MGCTASSPASKSGPVSPKKSSVLRDHGSKSGKGKIDSDEPGVVLFDPPKKFGESASKSKQIDPNDEKKSPEELYKAGVAAIQAGDVDNAVKLIQRAFERGFNGIDKFLLERWLIDFYVDQRYKDTLSIFKFRRHHEKAKALFAEGKYEEVKNIIESHLTESEHSSTPFAHSTMPSIYVMYCQTLAQLAKKAKESDPEEAASLTALIPEFAWASIQWGVAVEKFTEDPLFKEAVETEEFQKYLTRPGLPPTTLPRSEHPKWLLEYGSSLMSKGQFAEAFKTFTMLRGFYTHVATKQDLQSAAFKSFQCSCAVDPSAFKAASSTAADSDENGFLLGHNVELSLTSAATHFHDAVAFGFRDEGGVLLSDPLLAAWRSAKNEGAFTYPVAKRAIEEHTLFDSAIELFEKSQWKEAQDKLLAYEKEGFFSHHPTVLYRIACTNASSGQPESALEYLAKAYQAGFADYRLVKDEEFFKGLSENPEFKKIVRKMEIESLSHIGDELYDEQKYESAAEIYEQVYSDEILSGDEESRDALSVAAFQGACCAARLGKKDKAIALINKLAEFGFSEGYRFEDEVAFNTLRADADFQKAIEQYAEPDEDAVQGFDEEEDEEDLGGTSNGALDDENEEENSPAEPEPQAEAVSPSKGLRDLPPLRGVKPAQGFSLEINGKAASSGRPPIPVAPATAPSTDRKTTSRSSASTSRASARSEPSFGISGASIGSAPGSARPASRHEPVIEEDL